MNNSAQYTAFKCSTQAPRADNNADRHRTPFTPTLPTRPLSPQNADTQTLSDPALPLANASRLPRSKPFQRRNKAKLRRESCSQTAPKPFQRRNKAKQARAWTAWQNGRQKSRSLPAENGISAAEQDARFRLPRPRQAAGKPLASGRSGAFQPQAKLRAYGGQGHFSRRKRRGLPARKGKTGRREAARFRSIRGISAAATRTAYGAEGQIRGANGARARKLRQPLYASHTFGKLLAQRLPSPRATLTCTHQPNFKPPAPLPMA